MNAEREVTRLEGKEQLYLEGMISPNSLIIDENLPPHSHIQGIMKITHTHIHTHSYTHSALSATYTPTYWVSLFKERPETQGTSIIH